MAKEFKYNGYIVVPGVEELEEDKPLSYVEFIRLAKENYAKGGMFFVEFWEEKQFNDWVESFGEITEQEALKMFADELRDHSPT